MSKERGRTRRWTAKHRGRSTNTPKSRKTELKAAKQKDLERKWLEEDHEPEVSEFTSNAGIQVNIFITNDFYAVLVEQTNLYAEQFIAANRWTAIS